MKNGNAVRDVIGDAVPDWLQTPSTPIRLRSTNLIERISTRLGASSSSFARSSSPLFRLSVRRCHPLDWNRKNSRRTSPTRPHTMDAPERCLAGPSQPRRRGRRVSVATSSVPATVYDRTSRTRRGLSAGGDGHR